MYIDNFPLCCGASIFYGFDEDHPEAFFVRGDDSHHDWVEYYETWAEASLDKKAAIADLDVEVKQRSQEPTKEPLTVCIVADWQRTVMFPILCKHGWTLVRGATTVNPNTNQKLYLWYRDRSKAPVVEVKRKF